MLALALAATMASAAEPSARFDVASYKARALETSPEVRSAFDAFHAASDGFRGQMASSLLPTISFTAADYPWGYNPANGYQYQSFRLNGSDWSFNTTVNLNLFNSFQDYSRARGAWLAQESADRAYFAARQDRALAAIQAFYDLDAKLKLAEVARQNLKAQDEQYRSSLDLYNNGMKSMADLLKSETDLRSSQLRLLDSKADEKRSRVAFNTLIDRPGLAETELLADLEPGTTALPALEADLGRALETRPEVSRARTEVDRARVAVRQAVQAALPNFRADLTWNHQDQANFGLSNAAFGIPSPNYYLALSLSLPFGFNGFTQVYAAKAALEFQREAEETLASATRQVRSDVYGAYIGLEHDVESYALALQKEEIARRTLDLVIDQYRQNTADAIRMNQAQTDVLDAQVSRATALHSIFVDRAQYRRALGEPLW